jgi:TorA maturation chaperone TorD
MVGAQKGVLPRVFGKWDCFTREGGEELAKKSLLSSIRIFLQEYDWDATYTERQVASKISRLFLLTPVGALSRVEFGRWYTTLAKDQHLATWAKKYIEEFIFHYREEIKVWTQISEMLEIKRRANS